MNRVILSLLSNIPLTRVVVSCLLVILLITILGLTLVACAAPPSIPILTQSLTPASFQINDLSVFPTIVDAGGVVSITAMLTNIGGSDGEYSAELRINKIVELSKKIAVPAGEVRPLNFSVVKNVPGTYEVTLGGLAEEFQVLSLEALTQSSNVQAVEPAATSSSCCQQPAVTKPIAPKRGCGCCR